MHIVTSARYAGGYRVLLAFDDGSVKSVDLEPHLHGEVFEPLKNVDYFKTLRVNPDIDTVVWDNGADFSPDFLYEIGQPVEQVAGV
jgi:hypothetical protein